MAALVDRHFLLITPESLVQGPAFLNAGGRAFADLSFAFGCPSSRFGFSVEGFGLPDAKGRKLRSLHAVSFRY